MKIYVASRFENKDKVKKINKLLIEKGYELSGDWTNHVYTKPYDKNQQLSKNYSKEDMQAVLNADVFILLTNKKPGIGSTTELGAALALFLSKGKPKVYVVGENLDGNMFYYHPQLNLRKTIEEVLEEL